MSDPNTPPKPKPGSLRDRIAAFENKAAASQPAGPPPPRPKPAGFATWKPKQPSPPDSPAASPSTGGGTTEGVVRAGVGAMNATDAKESITRAGGSLKERMAALQGRGGFGGSAPPSTPPKPAAENKPKWKPPPAVVSTPAIGEDDEAEKPKEEGGEPEGEVLTSPKLSSVKSPPTIIRSPESGLEKESGNDKEHVGEVAEVDDGQGEESAEKEDAQVDEEEEERQRRAAIAARMAKLGGARIGMGPPLFARPGVPPPAKKPSAEPEPPKAEEEAPVETTTETTTEQESSPRPPTSMPVPAMPKRAGPPRRKSAKSTSPGVTSAEESPVPPAEIPASLAEDSAEPAIVPSDTGDVIAPVEVVQVPSDTAEEVKDDEGGQDASISPPQPVAEVEVKESELKEEQPREAQAEEEAEEGEEARKKRVAEKLAKMGGVNPFALPPMSIRRTSAGSIGSPPTSPPPPVRKSSIGSPPPPPEKPASLRRDSAGSVVGRRASADLIEGPTTAGTGAGAGVARRSSVGSVKSIKKVEEVEGIKEIVEGPESVISESEEGEMVASGSPLGVVDVEKPIKKPSVSDDDKHSEVAEHGKEQDENTLYARESQYDDSTHDVDYDDVTPRPPPRVPLIASAFSDTITSTTSAVVPQVKHDGSSSVPRTAAEQDSHHQRSDSDDDGMVDPRVVASVIPPPPSRSPPHKGSYSDTSATASAPLPPRIVPEPSRRESSGERLSGPSPPRRLVTQSPPEQSRRELDYEVDAGDEVRAGRDEVVGDDGGEESGSELAQSTLFVPPPKAATGTEYRTLATGGEVDEGEESEPPLHVPPPGAPESAGSDLGAGSRGPSEDRDTDSTSNASGAPLPVRMNVGGSTKPSRSVPPPPTPSAPLPVPTLEGEVEESGSEYDDEGDDYQQEEVLRTRPLSEKLDRGEVPLTVPPPLPVSAGTIHAPSRGVPAPPPEEIDKEVLDEDEGDPIDPTFYSPSARNSYVSPQAQTQLPQVDQVQGGQGQGQNLARSLSSSFPHPSAANVPRPPVPVETKKVKSDEEIELKEDVEKARKQTIAERMARLGGIKFGAAPVPGHPPIPVPRKSSSEHPETKVGDEEELEQPGHGVARDEASGGNEEENEEEERARRERIAAKLAGMGGMRIGMMPMAPPRQSHVLGHEPQAAPAPGKGDSGASESGASEDGVKVEAEESEMEEVGYEDVKGSEEGSGEEVPPPPPARPTKRRETGQSITTPTIPISIPPPPTTRPPVPVPVPFRRASVKSATQTNMGQQGPSQQSEYVIIDEPKVVSDGGDDAREEAPPPPPARPPHRGPPPTRMAPPAPTASLADSISSHWELPAIPSSSLGGDLSASWSDALDDSQLSTPQPPSQPTPVPVPPPAAPAPKSPEALHLNADDLMAMWGRVGVQICEIATTMHDQSKKALVGDGTYRGFVDAVLREVPNAARPQSKQIPYGYLVYVQNGTQVQKRASEIMPGDVIELVGARFKGHKGLGGYQLHVGVGEAEGGTGPVVGIVSEFEPKKSKTRVFQANQHVGQQTVEAASYRLEDLKSGLVKVYRVLEA